jgi:hydrogenase maturation protease
MNPDSPPAACNEPRDSVLRDLAAATLDDPATDTVVLGIGNVLWADEGFGVRCVEALGERFGFDAKVALVDGGTQGLHLLSLVQSARRLLILDAVDYGREPGTLLQVRGEEVPRFLKSNKMSLHQTGFQEVLMLSLLCERYPESVLLVGCQPELLDDYGGSLRPWVLALVGPRPETTIAACAPRSSRRWTSRWRSCGPGAMCPCRATNPHRPTRPWRCTPTKPAALAPIKPAASATRASCPPAEATTPESRTMCVAMPMQVLSLSPGHALVAGRGERRHVNTSLVGTLAPGDWVLVFLDSARMRIDAASAAEVNATLDLVEAAMQQRDGAEGAAAFDLPSQLSTHDLLALTGRGPAAAASLSTDAQTPGVRAGSTPSFTGA